MHGIIIASDTASSMSLGTACLILIVGLLCYLQGKATIGKKKTQKERVLSFEEGHIAFSPDEFIDIWNSYKGNLQDFDFIGCYILHNLTKDKYYVGQATHVPRRVHAHLTGHGNGDVYADYVYGDEFEIRTIDLIGSGYKRLDDLERDLIDTYDAYENGYNKTSGNK